MATDANGTTTLYHASNQAGPWRMETRSVRPENSMSLIVLVKIDNLRKPGFPDVATSIPADGKPSRRTGEAFDCLTWVKDTLQAANAAGIIQLPVTLGRSFSLLLRLPSVSNSLIDELVTNANAEAARFSGRAESGGGATVVK
jgi:hypothetical protein